MHRRALKATKWRWPATKSAVKWLQRSDVVVPLAALPAVEVEPDAEQPTASPSDDFDPEALPGVPRMMLREEPGEDRSQQVFDFLKECREEHVRDAEALAAVAAHTTGGS
jgi:hypothetical protein